MKPRDRFLSMTSATRDRVVVVGAGPVGLETALRAAHDGFDVTVLERGLIGAAIRRWKHVKFFTPFEMNSSSQGRLAAGQGTSVPGNRDIITGEEYLERYLMPLAHSRPLNGKILEHHEVISVSRSTYGKSDRIGAASRREQPFRILCRTADGERIIFAETLIDCTGFVSRHRNIGAGGILCPGEDNMLSDRDYQIPDVRGKDRHRFTDRHTVVVGSGYSAATTVCLLAELMNDVAETSLTWVTRGSRGAPILPIENDPLAERRELCRRANQVAMNHPRCRWIPGAVIDSITSDGRRSILNLSWPETCRTEQLVTDNIVANPGYRPDTRPFDELQVHRCYATEGPIKLAAHLLGENSGDCMKQSTGGADLLKNPEPDFFILGAASYGRNSHFLLQLGLTQIDELFTQFAASQERPA